LPRVGTLGMYFVHPDYRGTGVGTMLFNKAIAEWKKDGGNMALNGGNDYSFVREAIRWPLPHSQ
uniref:N-acetyltransferase domain-containing protein n=1 Tax=Anisakis simplex TaxID=6269 RepID=A0A0M3JDL3_ANISI